MKDGETGSDDENNDGVPGDPLGRPHGTRGLWVVIDLKNPDDPWEQWFLL